MNKTLVLLLLLFPLLVNAQVAKEAPLITKALPDVPEKEGLVEKVVLSPGQAAPPHRHNADVFAYVLDGTIITQVKGDKPQTVHPGEVFYESPADIHNGSRNASMTQPATLIVFFVKKIGAPPTIALHPSHAPH